MPSKPTSDLGHRWYLADWAEHLGKRQADAQRDLDWSRSTASGLWNGTQRYTQERVDEAAVWLGLKPYELLMPPHEALALRQFQESAMQIAGRASNIARNAPELHATEGTGKARAR